MNKHSSGKDILWLPDGSVYHLGAKREEISNRLLTVGDHARADSLAELFDKDKEVKSKISPRLFKIHSGYYKGIPITIVGIGMGTPMMDFFVRETSFLIDGPMAVVRLGSCGLANPKLSPGTIVVASKGSMYCYTNYAKFDGYIENNKNKRIDDLADSSAFKKPYIITTPILPDDKLTNLITKSLDENNIPYFDGLNIAGETFYSCQGRQDGFYNDENEDLLNQFLDIGVDTIEMESHSLLHLAKKCKNKISASALAVGIVNRSNPELSDNVSADLFKKNICHAGVACLEALAAIEL